MSVKTSVSVPVKAPRQEIAKTLNLLLSDEYVLYTKTRNFHWNVVGSQFGDLHDFFEKQYEQLDDFVDDVAERVRAVGGRAFGTMREFLDNGRIKEEAREHLKAEEMIARLRDDHEAVIRRLREDIGSCEQQEDQGTANFLTDLLEKHEKMAWMLRSYLTVR